MSKRIRVGNPDSDQAQYTTHLRECAVIPDVAIVGETVADEAQLALLDVLLDGVEWLLLGGFHLGVGPAGDLNNHVEDTVVLVCEEGNVMKGRDDGAILLDVDAVFYHADQSDGEQGGGRRT